MIDERSPAIPQDPEGVRPGAIWSVAAGVVVLSAVLVVIAWWLVVPPPAGARASQESPLEHGLIERASGGDEVRAAGEQQLDRTEWVDRRAGTVRIPIDRAIDAVVADPRLIGAAPSAVSGANTGARPVGSANTDAIRAPKGSDIHASPAPGPGEDPDAIRAPNPLANRGRRPDPGAFSAARPREVVR